MLPRFDSPVRWQLRGLPSKESVLPLLELERAEFEAVLGRPVHFTDSDDSMSNVWRIRVDPSVSDATLTAVLDGPALELVLPSEEHFGDGVNLLHSLAYASSATIEDVEAPSWPEAFDRIFDEIRNIYPSFAVRGLDWDAITDRHVHVRELEGEEFWAGARQWIAELGDAHTQLSTGADLYHPPYLLMVQPEGATLVGVPQDSDAWLAGVRPGDRLEVRDPLRWVKTTRASPQHRELIAGRRFLAMAEQTRTFAVICADGTRRTWTEHQHIVPVATGACRTLRIHVFTPEVPQLLRSHIERCRGNEPLVLDLRGNLGGDLVAAAESRRMLVRSRRQFGTVRFSTGKGTLAPHTALEISPAQGAWQGEVTVLVDGMTYSAAEDFLHPLIGLEHVRIVGGPTGGGSGRPHRRLIKDDVRLATSTAITYTSDGKPIEYHGIQSTQTPPRILRRIAISHT